MQPEPATWGAGDPVTTPDAALVVDLGDGPEALEVVSWDYARDLTGGSLPGQVRGASGFALGSGSAAVHVADGRTPWAGGSTLPGRSCTIEAGHGGDRLPQAAAQVRSMSAGSALSAERTLSLEDDLRALRSPAAQAVSGIIPLGWAAGTTPLSTDAASVIASVGAAAGFHAVPPPLSGCVLSLPLQGDYVAAVGSSQVVYNPPASSPWHAAYGWAGDDKGARRIAWSGPAGGSRPEIECRTDSAAATSVVVVMGHLSVADGSWAARVACTMGEPGELGDWPRVMAYRSVDGTVHARVRTEFDASTLIDSTTPAGKPVVVHLDWTSGQLRARVSTGGAWTAWSAYSPATLVKIGPVARVFVRSEHESVATYGVQVIDTPTGAAADAARDAAEAWVSSASIEPARVPMVIPPAPGRAPWETVQAAAAGTLGAAWIDERGSLVYRSRDSLRGADAPVQTLRVDGLADLPWSVSTDDVADRVQVSYAPPVWSTASSSADAEFHVVWEATEPIRVPAGGTVEVLADLGTTVGRGAFPFLPAWDALMGWSWSSWAAAPSPGGGGTQPPDTAIQVTAVQRSASSYTLTVRNTTAGVLYLVDGTGAPHLRLRSPYAARPGQLVTIASGLTEDVAVNALDVDLGSYVQDDATAQEMLAWITGMVTAPLPVLEDVEVVPDLRRQLGDVVTVVDPDHTGVRSKALIVGVRNAGRVGSLTQTLRLAVLDPTFNDLDRYLAAAGVVTFNDLDAHLDAVGVVTFDDLDAYLSTALVEEI